MKTIDGLGIPAALDSNLIRAHLKLAPKQSFRHRPTTNLTSA